MSFLIPMILGVLLPLSLLPILIHMLNRIRYKPVKWAAMSFLRQARRESRRMAKLREILILLLRTLMLILLALALAQPVSNSLGGFLADDEADLLIFVVDRSASMQSIGRGDDRDKCERLLKLAQKNIETMRLQKKQILVFDPYSEREFILKSSESLNDSALFRPGSAHVDIAQQLHRVTNYLSSNPDQKAKVWILSDLEASSWNPENSAWGEVLRQLQTLKLRPELSLLALPGRQERNASLREAAKLSATVRRIRA